MLDPMKSGSAGNENIHSVLRLVFVLNNAFSVSNPLRLNIRSIGRPSNEIVFDGAVCSADSSFEIVSLPYGCYPEHSPARRYNSAALLLRSRMKNNNSAFRPN